MLGDGAGLRGFDFGRLAGVDTLGMNAAYSRWDLIGWRPTHYACLDDALIDAHHNEIARLMAEGRVRSAFLTRRFLHHHPEAERDPRFQFLDNFIAEWRLTLGSIHRPEFKELSLLRGDDPSNVATGVLAVQYGARLGYNEIGLIGIDLDEASASTRRDEAPLRVEGATFRNESDAFDDYRGKSQAFHSLSPDIDEGELHVEAFRTLRDEFASASVDCTLFNLSPSSRLSAHAILPFRPVGQFLEEPALSAVVVPVTKGEREQLVSNLWLWSQPSFAPFFGPPPARRPVLAFIFNNADAAEASADVKSALARLPRLRSCFSEVRFHNLELSGHADRYERDDRRPAGEQGRRAGPNNMFFGGMAAVRDLPGYALWLETDCIPIRPNWLGRVNDMLSCGEQPWVMGSIYRGTDPLGRREQRHINGNAIYACGQPEFQQFLDKVWRPALVKLVRSRPELAFDCLLETMFELSDSMNAHDPTWKLLQSVAHRFRHADYIQNIVDSGASASSKGDQLKMILRDCPDTYIVHSRRIAAASAQMRHDAGSADIVSIARMLKSESPQHVSLPQAGAAPQTPVGAARSFSVLPSPAVLRALSDFPRWAVARLMKKKVAVMAALGAGVAGVTAALLVSPWALFAAFSLVLLAGLIATGLLLSAYVTTRLDEIERLQGPKLFDFRDRYKPDTGAIGADAMCHTGGLFERIRPDAAEE